jgi:nicotinate-nucleotide adenylyltransferase
MPEPTTSTTPRIGFFGGSFDPIHQGHVSVALEAVEQFNLQQILLCPAFFAPLRDQKPLFSAVHRLAMVDAVAQEHSQFVAYEEEILAQKTCFTYHTLQSARQNYPDSEIFLMLGDDQFNKLDQWKFHQEILDQFPLIIFNRNGTKNNQDFPDKFPTAKIHPLGNQRFPHSSTEIRKLIQQGTSISSHVPQSVLAYMTNHQLLDHRDL